MPPSVAPSPSATNDAIACARGERSRQPQLQQQQRRKLAPSEDGSGEDGGGKATVGRARATRTTVPAARRRRTGRTAASAVVAPPRTGGRGATALGASDTEEGVVGRSRTVKEAALSSSRENRGGDGADGGSGAAVAPSTSLVPADATNNTSASTYSNPMMGMMAGSPYYGMGMGMGMGMSPYGIGMGYGMGTGGGGLLFSGLNNFLFGFQNVVVSLGQAVQILGMNAQALHQLFDAATAAIDHALATLREMQRQSTDLSHLSAKNRREEEEPSQEEIRRRRRLKVLRWSMTLMVSYSCYKLVKALLLRRRSRRREHGNTIEGQTEHGTVLPPLSMGMGGTYHGGRGRHGDEYFDNDVPHGYASNGRYRGEGRYVQGGAGNYYGNGDIDAAGYGYGNACYRGGAYDIS